MNETPASIRKRIWSPIPKRPSMKPQEPLRGLLDSTDTNTHATATSGLEAPVAVSVEQKPYTNVSTTPPMPDRLPASRRTSIPPRPAFAVSRIVKTSQEPEVATSAETESDAIAVETSTQLERTAYTNTADSRSKLPRLNARDKLMAQALAEHGFLTRAHLAMLVASTNDSIRKRLDTLVREGVFARNDTAMAEPVYYLTERGADFASTALPLWTEGDPMANGYTHRLNTAGIAIRLSAGIEPSLLFDDALPGEVPLAVIPASVIAEAASVVRNGDTLTAQQIEDIEIILDTQNYPTRSHGWDAVKEPLTTRAAATLKYYWTNGAEIGSRGRAILPAHLLSGFDKFGNPEQLLDFAIVMPHMATKGEKDDWNTVFGTFGVRVELKRETDAFYKALLLKLWRMPAPLYRIVFFHHANTVSESIRRIWNELITTGVVEDTALSRNWIIFRSYVPVNYDRFETSEEDPSSYIVSDRRISNVSYSYLAG